MTGELMLTTISTPNQLRQVQRQQMRTVQMATSDLLATAALLEKALDGNINDEARALVNAAYFQVNQVQTTFEKLVGQIDSVQIEDLRRE
ncbi:hypothetical protein [Photobacterium damselae]|uniref:hypothetical protein n=1 Tax=Photobacterium damselae TaxID=38293 RepID=UPI001EFE2115|nr:hypothetical protein [Photobacterium damselae]MCG9780455.1 hypothetical protein [Photobacterium damselae]